jgi:endoglucanase
VVSPNTGQVYRVELEYERTEESGPLFENMKAKLAGIALGNRIVDQQGDTVVLRGMSLYWSQWQGSFYNEDAIRWLRDDFRVTLVRAAMAVDMGGYLSNPAVEKAKVKAVVDAAIKLGIYVIIDWHDHDAHLRLQQAQDFFEGMAQAYAGYPNVLYEIWNEPLDYSWAGVIKPYHEAVIPRIRAHDSLGIIILGSRNWDQDVDEAALNPVGGKNIAYSLHYYAATHKQSYRSKALTAMNRGAALIVTEWGTGEASGDGTLDTTETRQWWAFTDQHGISWCNWSVAALGETTAALRPGASPTGGWTAEDLSPSGAFVREQLRLRNPVPVNLSARPPAQPRTPSASGDAPGPRRDLNGREPPPGRAAPGVYVVPGH